MQAHHIWLIAGIVLCTTEMLTGTFFMLVIGLAAFAGAAVAWSGQEFWLQALVAAIVGVAGVIWVQSHRRRSTSAPMPSFDVGQPVSFERWVSQPNGMGRVNYRGSTWEARLSPGLDPAPGTVLYIRTFANNILEVSDQPPSAPAKE